MAIDPSISLAVRPPVIAPLQIQTPLEKFAKIQTLRNLMGQGQLAQLNIQQTQLENQALQRNAQEAQTLGSWMQQNQQRSQDITPQEIVAAHPNPTGIKFATAWSAQKTAELTQRAAVLDAAFSEAKTDDRIYNSVIDDTSKVAALAELVKLKRIDGTMASHLTAIPFDSPEFKGIQQRATAQSLDRLQRIEAAKKEIDLRIAKDTESSVTQKAINEATKAKQEVEGTQKITPYQQAQLQPKTAGDFIRIITDPESTPEQKAAAQKGLDLFGGLAAIEAGARTNVLLSPAKEAQEIRIAGGKAAANPNILDRESARFAKPHEKIVTDANTQLEKINEARAMINGPATAQALGIPKVLSSLVGGAGSGLRMTKAELDAIAKARGIGGDVEGFISKVSGEGVLTKEQQRQLTGLLDDVAERTRQKQAIANDALDRINSATSREEIVAIDTDVRKKLGQMQTGPAAAKLPEITSQAAYDALPKGAQYTHKGEVLTKK
jgi:hypothetical protein